MRQKTISLAAATLSLVALAACSVSDYEKPIAAFSDATAATEQALIGYTDAIAAELAAKRRLDALAQPIGVRAADGECLLGSNRCRIVLLKRPNDPAPASLMPEVPLVKMIALMSEIRKYADGLKGIVTSDSRTKVEASVAAVGGSVKNLAALAGDDGSGVADFSAPVAAAVGWLVGGYIDHVRYEALRIATKNADPILRRSTSMFEQVAKEAAAVNNARLAESVSKQVDEFKKQRTEDALTKLISAAQSYDAALTTPASGVFRQLADTHTALTRALNDGTVTVSTVFSEVETLRTEAEKVQSIVNDFRKAAQAKPE